MTFQLKKTKLELVVGNIIDQEVDAIVNAANTSLLGGGGVDGAIHRAAGPELLLHCKTLGGCKTGDARITPGFNLKTKHVIHTVGPVYRDGKSGEEKLLSQCYRRSLEVAKENGLKSIAFPSISTGAYRYPIDEAAFIALSSVADFLKTHQTPTLVRFVLFSHDAYSIYEQLLKDSFPQVRKNHA